MWVQWRRNILLRPGRNSKYFIAKITHIFFLSSLPQVALNNKILTDAMSSGLLEQSKPAWNFNRLDALWNDLRHEFSIGDRYVQVSGICFALFGVSSLPSCLP